MSPEPVFKRVLVKLSGTTGENVVIRRFSRFAVGA